MLDAKKTAHRFRRAFAFDGWRHARNHHRQDSTEDGVGDDGAAVAGDRAESAGHHLPGQKPARERAGRGRERSRQVVPGEERRSISSVRRLRQRDLLDGQKRSDFVAARTNDADRGRENEQREIARDREHNRRADHQ